MVWTGRIVVRMSDGEDEAQKPDTMDEHIETRHLIAALTASLRLGCGYGSNSVNSESPCERPRSKARYRRRSAPVGVVPGCFRRKHDVCHDAPCLLPWCPVRVEVVLRASDALMSLSEVHDRLLVP